MDVSVASLRKARQCREETSSYAANSCLIVCVPINFVGLKYEHVEQCGFAVVQMANHSYVANHLRERHHVNEETSFR
jgi:hypothetical protein